MDSLSEMEVTVHREQSLKVPFFMGAYGLQEKKILPDADSTFWLEQKVQAWNHAMVIHQVKKKKIFSSS